MLKLNCDILKITKLQKLDKFTLRNSKALLFAYVLYVSIDRKITEELFAKSLMTDTRGFTIFKFVEKCVPIINYIAFATDRVLAKVDHQCEFIAHLKNAVLRILMVHYIIHCQHLVAEKCTVRL